MAINRISYPSSTPTAVSDYEAQNALLVAALGEGNNVVPYVGTAMSVGFVFNVGGVVYRVDTATTITGTASPYVKITPSGATASASFSANLTGVTYNNVWNGYYDGSGNRYFFYGNIFDGKYTYSGGNFAELAPKTVVQSLATGTSFSLTGTLTKYAELKNEKVIGLVQLYCSLANADTATGQVQVVIKKNSSIIYDQNITPVPGAPPVSRVVTADTIISTNIDDIFELLWRTTGVYSGVSVTRNFNIRVTTNESLSYGTVVLGF